MSSMVGITTTVPVEVLLAAGLIPADLNNRFITHPDPAGLVQRAEELGLARTLCAWIKGIYAWTLEHPEVASVVAVTQGDCSNTHALMELLHQAGRRTIPFDFPWSRAPQEMAAQLERLASALGADLGRAEDVRRGLLPLRRDLARLDEMTWRTGQVTGVENHLWLVEASDFRGDPQSYAGEVSAFLDQAAARPCRDQGIRLGVVGVPPIWDDLYAVVEELGGGVVYNETPRQFAMLPPEDGEEAGLVEQYLRYTYPYDIFHRLGDIGREVERRGIQGLIHYTQSFCFRQMQDLILRQRLRMPILTLEGDRVGPVDARTRMRLEAFVDVLR